MAWKSKSFAGNDWIQVQNRFDVLFTALGSPDSMALLRKGATAEVDQKLYLASDDPSHADSLSDGGWEECGPPNGQGVQFLIGHNGFCERHGIELGL
jgi:hypothetical protein